LNSFWKLWRQQYLLSLAPEKRWRTPEFQFPAAREGDIVHVIEDGHSSRNVWNFGKVIRLKPGRDGVVRSVDVQLPSGKILSRPVRKLALLEGVIPSGTL
jgi:hypothetical protein